MIHTGLVSVTFRKLAPRAIVDLVAEARLEGIEWGGDIHVPHGNLARAREVAAMTAAAGLRVAAYGSYYRVGEETDLAFEAVLDTAAALGAPLIRVWAGDRGSAAADAAFWERVVAESRRIGNLAAAAGKTVTFEYHGGTLTDTDAAARQLIQRVAHDRVRLYWQPRVGPSIQENLDSLRGVLPWLANVHVFHWGPTHLDRHPLTQGEDDWQRYLGVIAGGDHAALLEFVRDDEPAQFLRDAATLRRWMGQG